MSAPSSENETPRTGPEGCASSNEWIRARSSASITTHAAAALKASAQSAHGSQGGRVRAVGVAVISPRIMLRRRSEIVTAECVDRRAELAEQLVDTPQKAAARRFDAVAAVALDEGLLAAVQARQ